MSALLGVMFAVSYLGAAGASVLVAAVHASRCVVGVAGLVAFVRHAGHAADPFIPLRLLRGQGFAVMNLINFFFGVAVLGFATLVPLYAQDRYGIGILAAGTLLTARAVGMIAVAGVATFALRRTGYRRPMLVGFVLCVLGLLLHGDPRHRAVAVRLARVAAAVTGLGHGLSRCPATNNAIMHLAPADTGAVAGLRGMFRQAGGITGVAVVTAVIARSGDPGIAQAWALVVLAAMLLAVPAPLILLVPEHRGSW